MNQRDFRFDRSTGLVIVDVQKDFCPGGALAVREGDRIIPVINQYIELFDKAYLPIFLTRDWHPGNHISFKQRGGPWPPHCIQDSEGAEFHPDLRVPEDAAIISKAVRSDADAYSAFEGTNLELELRRAKVRQLLVAGLATDYCVKNTVLDARRLDFETYLLIDAIRGVDVREGDSDKAVEEMKKQGAIPLTLDAVQAEFERFGYSLNNHRH